ncbi:hypothetical protein F5B19DRAFT_458595 [Rostrohypoxylon terebratum]|nr:hypothetical protein F5B19DRAFT_458595 [Rostrohypoxylon terebratum]
MENQQGPAIINGFECGYNPQKLSLYDNLSWVQKIYFVGYISDLDSTIMSGSARLTAVGRIELYPDDVRNKDLPTEYEYECYRLSDDKMTVHPFHWPCLEILARVLYPSSDDPISLITISDLDSTFSSCSNCENGMELLTGAEKRHGKP